MPQSPPSSIVTCPFCGYPYLMSEMQREIYIGRNMGCMNCGRPFKVDAPPPPASDPAAPAAEAAVAETDAAGPHVSAGATIAVPLDAGDPNPAQPGVSQPIASQADATAAPGSPGAATPGIGPKTYASRPNLPAVIGFSSALLFFVLIAAVTIVSAAASDADSNAAGGGFIPRTPAGILAGLAILSGVLALLLSAAGLVRTRRIAGPQGPVRTAGRGMAIAGMAIGGGGLLITALVLSTVMPVMNRQREMARREQCKANLQQIAAALATYANSNGGHYPDSLATLVAAGLLASDTLVCPSTTDHPAAGANAAAQAAALSQPGHQSYVYAAKNLISSAPTYTVLVYEPPDDHGDVSHVLFLDGYILPVPRSSAETLRGELDTGLNPGPTAKSLRP